MQIFIFSALSFSNSIKTALLKTGLVKKTAGATSCKPHEKFCSGERIFYDKFNANFVLMILEIQIVQSCTERISDATVSKAGSSSFAGR